MLKKGDIFAATKDGCQNIASYYAFWYQRYKDAIVFSAWIISSSAAIFISFLFGSIIFLFPSKLSKELFRILVQPTVDKANFTLI